MAGRGPTRPSRWLPWPERQMWEQVGNEVDRKVSRAGDTMTGRLDVRTHGFGGAATISGDSNEGIIFREGGYRVTLREIVKALTTVDMPVDLWDDSGAAYNDVFVNNLATKEMTDPGGAPAANDGLFCTLRVPWPWIGDINMALRVEWFNTAGIGAPGNVAFRLGYRSYTDGDDTSAAETNVDYVQAAIAGNLKLDTGQNLIIPGAALTWGDTLALRLLRMDTSDTYGSSIYVMHTSLAMMD